MGRRLVIGDIHGGLKAIHQVFERAQVKKEDTLIFLGDYVDGWSESAGVVEYMMELNAKQPCVFIKGNHDVWCEEWLRSGKTNPVWVMHGGKETIDSYQGKEEAYKSKHLEFLERMPYYYIDDANRLFIHAGFTSMHGPEKEFHNSNFSWDRTLWEMALTMDSRIEKNSAIYPKRLKLFSEIYIGHTPTLYYNQTTPMRGINVWNIDTGAAFTGKLTVLDVSTKEFWQSDTVQSLYPGERGRNRD